MQNEAKNSRIIFKRNLKRSLMHIFSYESEFEESNLEIDLLEEGETTFKDNLDNLILILIDKIINPKKKRTVREIPSFR